MNLRQANLAMINAYPGGWDAMAAALGVSRDSLENRIYERKGQSLSVHQELQMQKFSGTSFFAEAIATESSGVFTQLAPPGPFDREELQAKFHELYAELGDLSRRYTEYTRDNHVDKRERAKLQAIADDIHKTLTELTMLIWAIFCTGEDDVSWIISGQGVSKE